MDLRKNTVISIEAEGDALWEDLLRIQEELLERILGRYRSASAAYEAEREEYLRDWFVQPLKGPQEGQGRCMLDHLADLYRTSGREAVCAFVYRSLKNRSCDFRRLRKGQLLLAQENLEENSAHSCDSPESYSGSARDRIWHEVQTLMERYCEHVQPKDAEYLRAYLRYLLDGKGKKGDFASYALAQGIVEAQGKSPESIARRVYRQYQQFQQYCQLLGVQ